MFKKVMVMVSFVMFLTLGVVLDVKADTTSQAMLDYKVRSFIRETEADICYGLAEEGEAKVRAIELAVGCIEIEKGIYDTEFGFTIYKKYTYTYHTVYDAYEEEALATYWTSNGIRYTPEEMEKILEDKFPELM